MEGRSWRRVCRAWDQGGAPPAPRQGQVWGFSSLAAAGVPGPGRTALTRGGEWARGGCLRPSWASGKAAPVTLGRIHLQRGRETSPNLGQAGVAAPRRALREGAPEPGRGFWLYLPCSSTGTCSPRTAGLQRTRMRTRTRAVLGSSRPGEVWPCSPPGARSSPGALAINKSPSSGRFPRQ